MTKILAATAIAAALVLPVATPASAFTISLPFFRISIPLGVGPSYRHASRPSVRHARRATPERVATSRPRPNCSESIAIRCARSCSSKS